MYGAFIGNIVGAKYEGRNINTKDFPLFPDGSRYTGNSIATAAVASAIIRSRDEQYKHTETPFQRILTSTLKNFCNNYPLPKGYYGERFERWLSSEDPHPYESYGNGAAARVSPCGLAAVTVEEARALARASACVTHDHPEAIKGAEAVASATFLANNSESKKRIKLYIEYNFYDLNFTLDSIRGSYSFDNSARGSVPQAIVAFLESYSLEDAVRNAVSLGGGCDATATIAGAIARAYYARQASNAGEKDEAAAIIEAKAKPLLPGTFVKLAEDFYEICWRRAGTFYRAGSCTPILNIEETKRFRCD